jgi:hypothetical protein
MLLGNIDSNSGERGGGGFLGINFDEQAQLATHFNAGFFLGLFFDLEDGGDIFLQNVD